MKKLKSSTDHFTGRERHALHHIKNRLAGLLQPQLILYLGSLATTTLRRHQSAVTRQATDFRFSCELVVVLPSGSPLLSDRSGLRVVEGQLGALGDVRLLALSAEGLASALQSGRHPRLQLHGDAIVLYEKDHTLQKVVALVQAADAAARGRKAARGAGPAGRSSGEGGGVSPCLPVGLSAVERADPLSVVLSFYRTYDLPEVRDRIGSWLSAVVSSPSWPVSETGLHLDFYVSVCRLVESAWLLRGCDVPSWVSSLLSGAGVGGGLPPQSLYCPHEGADAWTYFPAHLSRGELGCPGAVFAGLFSARPLSWWQSELYDLFSYSLTDCTPSEAGEDRDLSGVTQWLHRLAEACHLLSVWHRRAPEHARDGVAAGASPVGAAVSEASRIVTAMLPAAMPAPVTSVL